LYSFLKSLQGTDNALFTAALVYQYLIPALVDLAGGTCKVYDAVRVEDTLKLLKVVNNDIEQGVYLSSVMILASINGPVSSLQLSFVEF
jgi:hypothetical protein